MTREDSPVEWDLGNDPGAARPYAGLMEKQGK